MNTVPKQLPECLKRSPLWVLSHDINPDDPAVDAVDPDIGLPEDGYGVDAAGTFEG